MSRGTIKSARISAMPVSISDPMPEVWVTFEDGEDLKLFSYYPDEISFTASEFVGLTEPQARELRHKRDVAYLRS